MAFDLTTAINIMIPVVVTILGNILFYISIKSKVDKSIEQHKIAYSGIFKERINVYRELLDRTTKLQTTVGRFHYTGDKKHGEDFVMGIEEFINCYLKNSPFLSPQLESDFKVIREKLQTVFEGSYLHYSLMESVKNNPLRPVSKETDDKSYKSLIEASNVLKSGELQLLRDSIVKEMRIDLQTSKT